MEREGAPDPNTGAAPLILMFSGGRDSTIAAARLCHAGSALSLVTISSGHLVGIERVRSRIQEMGSILPSSTRWLHVRQPTALLTDTTFYEKTCLPCHHSYVVASSVLAYRFGVRKLAFGYTHYQSGWPEQSPMAVASLTSLLSRYGIELLLPAYDLDSRATAERELIQLGLSSASLEQKCLQQIQNVSLADEPLREQITLWERAIDESISKLREIKIEILEDVTIGSV